MYTSLQVQRAFVIDVSDRWLTARAHAVPREWTSNWTHGNKACTTGSRSVTMGCHVIPPAGRFIFVAIRYSERLAEAGIEPSAEICGRTANLTESIVRDVPKV